MKKRFYSVMAVATLASSASFNASAALASNAVLLFNDGVNTCTAGISDYPDCVNSGSYFAVDTDFNGAFTIGERTAMERQSGVSINTMQPGSSSWPGPALGTIDAPFTFLGADGVHQTTSPVTILSDDGAGHVALNFSGWGFSWNSVTVPLGGDVALGEAGIASLICGIDCALGDTFTLDYTAHVPVGDLSNWGGAFYGVHLEGVISAVPVPAAFWLFGSGLVGLIGFAKRKASSN